MRKFLPISLVFVLLTGACSDASETDQPSNEGTDEVAIAPTNGGEPSAGTTPSKKRRRSKGGERRMRNKQGDAIGSDEGGHGEETSEEGDAFNDGGGEDDNSSALHPAAGRYVYEQTGFERFCQAATCEQQPLPSRQPIVVSVRQPSVVISEITSSDNRLVRTTTVFGRESAQVTNVYARFSYEGFTFENEYEPRPPVESLRFPLEEGARWSGRWEDSTSGDYTVSVLGRENVEVQGGAIAAYKLATVTNFRGEFNGSSKAILWIDNATKTVVKTSGKLDLRSSFGRYISEFNNKLRSGPGYR